jgi:hypothetical protein
MGGGKVDILSEVVAIQFQKLKEYIKRQNRIKKNLIK